MQERLDNYLRMWCKRNKDMQLFLLFAWLFQLCTHPHNLYLGFFCRFLHFLFFLVLVKCDLCILPCSHSYPRSAGVFPGVRMFSACESYLYYIASECHTSKKFLKNCEIYVYWLLFIFCLFRAIYGIKKM